MTAVPAAIAVPRPEVPALGDSPLENVKTLFGLTAGELARLFGVTERQVRRYLAEGNLPRSRQRLAEALMAVGLTVIGGLGTTGAREWLYGGEPSAAELAGQGRIDELASRAYALRDSPFT
ncbi:MAG: MerR family transcriptional regulator [Solirubrobacteraceae bacterium]